MPRGGGGGGDVSGGGHDGNGKLQIVGHRLAVQRLGCMDLSGQFHLQ